MLWNDARAYSAIVRRAGHAAPLVSAPSEKKIQPEKPVCKSKIKQKLDEGKRVVLVELDPPRSADLGGFMQGARAWAQAGADAITIADCPIGRARRIPVFWHARCQESWA